MRACVHLWVREYASCAALVKSASFSERTVCVDARVFHDLAFSKRVNRDENQEICGIREFSRLNRPLYVSTWESRYRNYWSTRQIRKARW